MIRNQRKAKQVLFSKLGSDQANLITLKFVSICQSCKIEFDSSEHLPYLLKCGHFFCKNCILSKYSNKSGKRIIVCPVDGEVANSLSELKILKNLINFDTQQEYNEDDEQASFSNVTNLLLSFAKITLLRDSHTMSRTLQI